MNNPEYKWIECGCCGAYHRYDYYGDCRNDEERFDSIPDEDEGRVLWLVTQMEDEEASHE